MFFSKVYAPSLYITHDDNVAIFPGYSGHFSCVDLINHGHYEVHGDDIGLPVAEQSQPSSSQSRFQFHRPAQHRPLPTKQACFSFLLFQSRSSMSSRKEQRN